MLWKRTLITIPLLAFLCLTARAVLAQGYMGVIAQFLANPGTQLLSADLVISLSLVTIWMVTDAQKRQNAFVPFVLITLLFGVAGPLLYLLLRDFSPKVQRAEAILVLVVLCLFSVVIQPPDPAVKTDAVLEMSPDPTYRNMAQPGRHDLSGDGIAALALVNPSTRRIR